VDEDPRWQGKVVDGMTVYPPNRLREFPDLPLFICSREKPKIMNYLKKAHAGGSLVL